MEERIRFVVTAMRVGVNFSGLCREFGISRPTGYRWLSRYREAGSVLALVDRSRRPHESPRRTEASVESQVVGLRREYGWGAKKLRELLLSAGQDVKVATINRIIQRNGMVARGETGHAAPGRFERACPNELWQMDFKGEFVWDRGLCYPLTVVDDHSRFAVAVFALPRTQGSLVQRCLHRTFQEYGLPEAMLMDHGSPWWSTTNGYGLTMLSIWLIKQGIHLLYSGFRHPQTQGKVERFHRTLKEDVVHHGRPETLPGWQEAFDRFRHRYNYLRPHESLDMAVPAQRYVSSPRRYCEPAAEWCYPAGATVKRLSSHGCLPHRGRYYFVCEALAHEWVRIEELPQRLLVSYRHMYIREIDLDTKLTRPLIIPVSSGHSL